MSLLTTMLESVCSISRPVPTRDSLGGQGQSFNVIASGVACSDQESTASAFNIYGQRNTVNSTTVFFGEDPGTEINDLLAVTQCYLPSNPVVNYLVVGEAQAVARGVLWAVECTRLHGSQLPA